MANPVKSLDELADVFADLCQIKSDRSAKSDKPQPLGDTDCPTSQKQVGQGRSNGTELIEVADTGRPENAKSASLKPACLCTLPDKSDMSDQKQVMPENKTEVVGGISIDPVNFAERAAALEYDGSMGRDEAEQSAALELGHVNAVALYEVTVKGWQQHLHHIAEIAEIAATQRAKEIIRDAHAFLHEWGLTALQMGWDEQDLFRCTAHDLEAIGMHAGFGKKPQLQRLGLIFFIHGGRVELITRETATIRTVSGQVQSFPRYGPGHNQGDLIWEVMCNG